MNLTQYAEQFCNENIKITIAKNRDYAGVVDIFSNFTRVEKFNVRPIDGFITRMVDKVSRIENLSKREAAVKSESIADTLHDLANYCMLLTGFLDNVKNLGAHAEKFYGKTLDILISEQGKTDYIKNLAVQLKVVADNLKHGYPHLIDIAKSHLLKISVHCILISYGYENNNRGR